MIRALVIFQNNYGEFRSNTYMFKTVLKDLEEGDLVVVETVNGLQVAKFVGYSDQETKSELSRIICRVDLTDTPDLKNL